MHRAPAIFFRGFVVNALFGHTLKFPSHVFQTLTHASDFQQANVHHALMHIFDFSFKNTGTARKQIGRREILS